MLMLSMLFLSTDFSLAMVKGLEDVHDIFWLLILTEIIPFPNSFLRDSYDKPVSLLTKNTTRLTSTIIMLLP